MTKDKTNERYLYRGISKVTSTWIFGYLIIIKDQHWIVYEQEINHQIQIFRELVCPETIGKFTNQYDDLDVPIFEDDILYIRHAIGEFNKRSDDQRIELIRYIDGTLILSDEDDCHESLALYNRDILSFKVVGNLHEPMSVQLNLVLSTKYSMLQEIYKPKPGELKREILYRAKDVEHSRWLFGSIIIDTDTFYIIHLEDWGDGCCTEIKTPIAPNTIGEFCGILDIHKNLIFEDDFVQIVDVQNFDTQEFSTSYENDLLQILYNLTNKPDVRLVLMQYKPDLSSIAASYPDLNNHDMCKMLSEYNFNYIAFKIAGNRFDNSNIHLFPKNSKLPIIDALNIADKRNVLKKFKQFFLKQEEEQFLDFKIQTIESAVNVMGWSVSEAIENWDKNNLFFFCDVSNPSNPILYSIYLPLFSNEKWAISLETNVQLPDTELALLEQTILDMTLYKTIDLI